MELLPVHYYRTAPIRRNGFKRCQKILEDIFQIGFLKIIIHILQLAEAICFVFEIADHFYFDKQFDDFFETFSSFAYLITMANALRFAVEELRKPKPLQSYASFELFLIIAILVEFLFNHVIIIINPAFNLFKVALMLCQILYATYEMMVSPMWRLAKWFLVKVHAHYTPTTNHIYSISHPRIDIHHV